MNQTVEWLRMLAAKGGKGTVDNIDARNLGRIADELERWEAALHECAAEFDTGPTTMLDAIPLIKTEFERRMHAAYYALHPKTGN